MANYIGFLAPKVALFSNIGLMVAVLLWRPQGLYPVTKPVKPRCCNRTPLRTTCRAAAGSPLAAGADRASALAFAPFLFPGAQGAQRRRQDAASSSCWSASFDLLLGYTGIVSFAHTMFFGIGAYGVAIASTRLGAELVGASLVGAGWRAGALAACCRS